jgi:hypothetical protein
MANLFQEGLTGSNDSLFGPTYSYYKNTNSPFDISMSDKESSRHTSKDINKLIEHMELLVNGKETEEKQNTPLGFFTNFLYGSNPPYQSITIKTISDENANSSESHYVTLVDKEDYSSDSDSDIDIEDEDNEPLIPGDPVAQLYFATLGVFGLFILYRLMQKSR